MAEDMTDLMLAYLEVAFDRTRLAWSAAEKGAFLGPETAVVLLDTAYQTEGRAVVDMGRAGLRPHGGNGTGAIAQLPFRAMARGNATISLAAGTRTRDSANEPLVLETLVPCVLQIE